MTGTVSFLMAQVCKAHRNAANVELGKASLHVGQEMVLVHLWQQNGVTQSELADQLCVEAPTVTRMLQRMEREELVTRRADPDDARVSRVYLTAKGRAIRPAVETAWGALEARTMHGLTADEQQVLQSLLTRVLRNLSLNAMPD